MDEIVKQALAKWPNVPHCYGWLALDARGNWRMRNEEAQAKNLPGDKISNPALLQFINRNYLQDEQGCWYFQNGPQRVYVNLETTPYVAHTDPQQGFVLHTGETLNHIDAVWITEAGELLLQQEDKVALIDDRDITQCLGMLQLGDQAAMDEQVLAWLANPAYPEQLYFCYGQQRLPVQRVQHAALASQFNFVARPQTGQACGLPS